MGALKCWIWHLEKSLVFGVIFFGYQKKSATHAKEFCAWEKENDQCHQILIKSFLKSSYLDHGFQ
jgi:hypothetical protein